MYIVFSVSSKEAFTISKTKKSAREERNLGVIRMTADFYEVVAETTRRSRSRMI